MERIDRIVIFGLFNIILFPILFVNLYMIFKCEGITLHDKLSGTFIVEK